MRSSKEKVIADCEWAINKILSQGSTTVTSMQFFKDVLYYLKHSKEIVLCKDCKYWDYRTEGCMHLTGKIAPIVKTGPKWFCADGKRKNDE